LQRKQVSTRGAAPRDFLRELVARSEPDGYVAIVEACGFLVAGFIVPQRLPEIVLAQPEDPGKRKTDRRDANQLGELLWVNRHRLLARASAPVTFMCSTFSG
jgi:hypothetical protein